MKIMRLFAYSQFRFFELMYLHCDAHYFVIRIECFVANSDQQLQRQIRFRYVDRQRMQIIYITRSYFNSVYLCRLVGSNNIIYCVIQ